MAAHKEVTSHYVTRVVVERVDHTQEFDLFSGGQKQPKGETKRDVIELANFMVKDSEMDQLKGKLANHIGLIDDSLLP